jgi:hypothetical protein
MESSHEQSLNQRIELSQPLIKGDHGERGVLSRLFMVAVASLHIQVHHNIHSFAIHSNWSTVSCLPGLVIRTAQQPSQIAGHRDHSIIQWRPCRFQLREELPVMCPTRRLHLLRFSQHSSQQQQQQQQQRRRRRHSGPLRTNSAVELPLKPLA